jgi:hypothetical protein
MSSMTNTHSCGGDSRRTRARKERVLHTRISDDLAEDLRKMAEDLRVPVSNIVRTVLEDAFSVVEKVTDNVGELIEEVVDEAEAASARLRRRHRHRRRHGRRPYRDAYRADAYRELEGDEEDSEPVREASEPEVLGWQPLVLAGDRRCSDCGSALARGAQAHAAVTQNGIGNSILCQDCLSARSAAPSQ